MSEAYCGKTCVDCTMRAELNCPGCMSGPGSEIYGTCTIAKCCRDRVCEGCESCVRYENCLDVATREQVPVVRKARHAAKVARKAVMEKRAPFFGKWLWALFWVNILCLFDLSDLFKEGSTLHTMTTWVLFLPLLANSLILLLMGQEEKRYKIAGWCYFGVLIHQVLLTLTSVNGEPPLWSAATILLMPWVELFAAYQEMTGHASVASDVDFKLSEKWEKLRQWIVCVMTVIVLSSYLVVILQEVVVFVVGIAAIILMVLTIMQIVYLYKMAQGFRKYKL